MFIFLSLLPLTPLYADEAPSLPPLHHLVGIKASDAMHIPSAFKLGKEQELICATCHGLKDIDKTPVKDVDTRSADFLVGGSYRKITKFCYRCHGEKQTQRKNIHLMLDEQGEIKKQQCEYCHEEVPDREKVKSFKESKLRLPLTTLCLGCHLKDPHFNAVEHQVKPAKEAMLKRIAKNSQQQGIIVPLTEKHEIVCVSCHSAHQYGVIDPKTPAGKQVQTQNLVQGVTYQSHPWEAVVTADKLQRLTKFNQQHDMKVAFSYQRIEQETLLRLPAKNGQLCLVCHDFEN
jgi:hypothetical protein